MKWPRLKEPRWLRNRNATIALSVGFHVVLLAFLVTSYRSDPRPQDVVIEFQEPARPFEAPTPADPAEATGKSVVEPGNPGVASKTASQAAVSRRTQAFNALLAMDVSSLRSNVAVQAHLADGPAIQTAGFGLAEPTIHLTQAEIDTLVSQPAEGRARKGKRRGVLGRGRGPGVCLPPR